MDVPTGFYDSPETRLTEVASEALADIYKKMGFDIEADTTTNVRAAVFIMQLTGTGGDGHLDEEVGVAFGGFAKPEMMIEHLLLELTNMAQKIGISMVVENIASPADFSQN